MFAVAGVTGNTGSVVAQKLLDAGKKVRAIVRDPAKGEAWRKKGAEVAVADLAGGAALTKALADVEGAYLLIPPAAPAASGVLERGRRIAQAEADALGRSGAKHAVFLSSLGADLPSGNGIVQTLYEAEQTFSTLELPVTFLRAAGFIENLGAYTAQAREGQLPSFFAPANRKLPMVDTRDIGETAARLLLEGPGAARVVELSGPQDYSIEDAAAAFAKALGRDVQPAIYSTDGMVQTLTGFGFSEELARLYLGLTEGINSGRISFGARGAKRVRGSVTLEKAVARLV